jgi:DNA-binding beta-propeller fold protein YncE
VADRGNGRIVRVDDMSGAGWTTYGHKGSLGPGELDLLGGIAVASDGRIYVTDANENVVVSIADMTGAGYANFGHIPGDSLFKQPTGIAVDGAGPVYVASENNNHVDQFQDISGTGYRTFGRPASASSTGRSTWWWRAFQKSRGGLFDVPNCGPVLSLSSGARGCPCG